MRRLPILKQSQPEYKIIGSQCLQDLLQRLDKTYKAFFHRIKSGEKQKGFPRFKSQNRYDSFALKQSGWKLEGRCLYIKNVGRFKLFLSRPIAGVIKTVTIRRSSTSKWFVAFSCENAPIREVPKTVSEEIGIEVGIKSFAVDSEGNQIPNPKYLKQSLKRLRVRQRSLARKEKGSNRRKKARLLVSSQYEKITNQRKDFLHKLSNFYIEKYKTIYIENLNINDMIKNRYFARGIADSCWGMFFNFLFYKAEGAGRKVIKVNPNGTSQICSGCGEKVQKSLSVRMHKCPFCNLVLDRDHNASLNILRFGQNYQALSPQVGLA